MFVYITSAPPDLSSFESEKYFLTRPNGSKEKFPSINEKATIDLSVIVPSYNEEERCKCCKCQLLESFLIVQVIIII